MNNKYGWERFRRLPQAKGLRVVQGNHAGAASTATSSYKGITNTCISADVELDTRNQE